MKILSTGLKSLDIALGGGILYPSIIEISGAEATGKTALSLQLVNEHLNNNKHAIFIDSERSLNASYIGDKKDHIAILEETNVEDIIKLLSNPHLPRMIVIDSISTLITKELNDKSIQDYSYLTNRTLYVQVEELMRKLNKYVMVNNGIVIITNQIRGSLKGIYKTTNKVSTSFYSNVRLSLENAGAIVDQGEEVGLKIKTNILKNKAYSKKAEPIYFDINYYGGIDTDKDLITTAIINNIIVRKGSWYFLEDRQLGQGMDSVIGKVNNDNVLKEEITKKLEIVL